MGNMYFLVGVRHIWLGSKYNDSGMYPFDVIHGVFIKESDAWAWADKWIDKMIMSQADNLAWKTGYRMDRITVKEAYENGFMYLIDNQDNAEYIFMRKCAFDLEQKDIDFLKSEVRDKG